MPNHVTNILVVSGDEQVRQAMFEAIKGDEVGLGSIDFNKVIPMPEHIFRGNLGPAERAQYGSDNWYDWSVANWGTKWNSYGYHDYTEKDFDGATLTFDTAWSSPQPVIAALAEKFPDLHFSHKWADEDFGYNVGEKEYENGEESFSHVPEGGSKEALELAADIHGLDLADAGYVFDEKTGTYEYHDPEEAPMSLQMQ